MYLNYISCIIYNKYKCCPHSIIAAEVDYQIWRSLNEVHSSNVTTINIKYEC